MSGKRLKRIYEQVDRNKVYPLEEAVALVKKNATAKFDETVEIAVKLGIDPQKTEQGVRGTAQLPHGTGKTCRVAVFATGAQAEEARGCRSRYRWG